MKKYNITGVPYEFWILDGQIVPRLRGSLIPRYGLETILEKLMDEVYYIRIKY
jgi:hypothetical protein